MESLKDLAAVHKPQLAMNSLQPNRSGKGPCASLGTKPKGVLHIQTRGFLGVSTQQRRSETKCYAVYIVWKVTQVGAGMAIHCSGLEALDKPGLLAFATLTACSVAA
jgi:hypothetical protein